MTDERHPTRNSPEDEATIRMLKEAGTRPELPPEDFDRIRDAVRAEWARAKTVQDVEDRPLSPSERTVTPTVGRVAGQTHRRTDGWRGARVLLAAGLFAALVGALLWRSIVGDTDPNPQGTIAANIQTATTVEVAIGSVSLDGRPVATGDRVPAGAVLRTSSAVSGSKLQPGLTVRLSSGHSLRLDADSSAWLTEDGTIHLERGAIYLDSGHPSNQPPRVAPVEVSTPLGTVTEIGTQFEVRLLDPADLELRVRVREGEVRWQREVAGHPIEASSVVRGNQLTVGAIGAPLRWSDLGPDSPEWDRWTALAPGLALAPGPLADVLAWFCRERGLSLHYADTTAQEIVAETQITWFPSQRPDEAELKSALEPAVPELTLVVAGGDLVVQHKAGTEPAR